MAEYELVHEIQNLCKNNQMRDIFFEEVECENPEAYLRQRLAGHLRELSRENGSDGSVRFYAVVDGLMEKFLFTPL